MLNPRVMLSTWSMLLLGTALGWSAPLHTPLLSDAVSSYIGNGLELAVLPTPREAKLTDRLLVVPRVEIATRSRHPVLLRDAQRWIDSLTPARDKPPAAGALSLHLGELGDGSEADRLLQAAKLVPPKERLSEMGEQGYVLLIGTPPGKPDAVVALAGVGPAGTLHGLQTLKQLTVARDGKVFVRLGHVLDWPAMPWRGSKRPLAWEQLFKANFGPLRGDDQRENFRVFFGAGADPQRGLKSWELNSGAKTTASRGLDASDAFLDHLFRQWETEFRRTGNPLFTLKGDDIELALDEKSGTRKRFADNYGAAFVHLLTELNRRLKKLDPRCTLYWMPNPYYTVNWDFDRLSRQVREAGGVPSEVGLWWTGHYVFSGVMTADDIHGYQKAFYGTNPLKVRGLIYDNHGRAEEPGPRLADFFAMPRRDPFLARHLMGLSNERGSWVNRITSYDFQWNPDAYDPDRSLRLAVRELANRDPAYYRLLLAFLRAWEVGRYPSPQLTNHAAIVRQQKESIVQLREMLPPLQAAGQKALDRAAVPFDPRDGDFRRHFLDQLAHNVKLREGLQAFHEQMWRDAPGPGYLIPTGEAPRIDGKLDDACYRRLPTLDRFVTAGGKMTDAARKPLWEVPAGVVPEDLATQGWLLADERHLYLAFRCKDRAYPRPDGQKVVGPVAREKVGNDHPYCWRQWCLDINLDVKLDRVNTFHLIFDPLGQVYDEYLGWPGDPLPTGPRWDMGGDFKVSRDGDSWSVEAAIPLAKLGLKQVKRGDAWGTNVYRSGINLVSMFSLLKDTGPYGVRYPRVFGHVHWR